MFFLFFFFSWDVGEVVDVGYRRCAFLECTSVSFYRREGCLKIVGKSSVTAELFNCKMAPIMRQYLSQIRLDSLKLVNIRANKSLN